MSRCVVWLTGISTLRKEAAGFSEGLVLVYETTRRYIQGYIVIIVVAFYGTVNLTQVSVFKAMRPNFVPFPTAAVGQGLLISEASQSHSDIPHG